MIGSVVAQEVRCRCPQGTPVLPLDHLYFISRSANLAPLLAPNAMRRVRSDKVVVREGCE